MSNSSNPRDEQPPADGLASHQPPSPQAPPPHSPGSAPAAPPQYAAPTPVPGKTLGVVAFIVAFFFNLVGLILGVVALLQSKRAGHKNGFALAAIIVGAISIAIGVIALVVIFSTIGSTCAELGPGTHILSNGTTVTCG